MIKSLMSSRLKQLEKMETNNFGEMGLRLKLFVIVFLIGLILTQTGVLAQQSKLILRCADVHAFGYPTIEGVLYMAQMIETRTNGRIKIVIYPEGSLGSEGSVVEMLQLGALDMGRVSLSQVAEISPELGVLMLPYIFKDATHKWKVLEGEIGSGLLNNLVNFDLIGLCFQESGHRSFYNSKRPIYRPEDLRGLKIRVQPSQIMFRLIEYFEASPVPIDYNDVYPALAAGVIDGAENNIPSYLTSGHYKVAGYFSFDKHVTIPEIVLISKKTWQKLSDMDRKIIQTAAKESVPYQRKLWSEFEITSRKKLEEARCKFNEVDEDAFRVGLENFYRKYAKQYEKTISEIGKVE
jgi:tripartite ATP-independent transporter DctP family solute receptor